MPVDDGASVWFPLVFPILFPIIFPMGFMMFFVMRRGGPMGMMMGGHSRSTRSSVEPPPRSSRGGRADRESGATHAESPLEVAQRRYAAGDISRDEFQRIRKDLDAP